MAARPKTAARMPPAGMTTLAPLSVAEAAAELADEAAEERDAVEEEDDDSVSLAEESVAVAVELPLVDEAPEEVARELVLELEP